MSAIRTRKPNGKIPYPFVLVEGMEGSGKTYSQLALSADDRIKHAFHIDLGEGSADEYAEVGNFDIIEHNGTYADIANQIVAVKEFARETMAANPADVVLLSIDSVTALWGMFVDEANAVTKARGKDDVTMDLWNSAKRKWRFIVDHLMTFPGIVVVSARGGEVVDVVNGKPTNNKIWKVQAEKSLGYDVNVWVRFTGHQQAVLLKARSLKPELSIPEGKTRPLPRFNLAELIFDKMGCGTEPTAVRTVTTLKTSTPEADAEISVRDAKWLLALGLGYVQGQKSPENQALVDEAVEAWKKSGLSTDETAMTTNGVLADLIKTTIAARKQPEAPTTLPTNEDGSVDETTLLDKPEAAAA